LSISTYIVGYGLTLFFLKNSRYNYVPTSYGVYHTAICIGVRETQIAQFPESATSFG